MTTRTDVFEVARASLQAYFQGHTSQPQPKARPTWGVIDACPCGQACATAAFVQYQGNGAWLLPERWTVSPDERKADTTWKVVDGDGQVHRLWAREI